MIDFSKQPHSMASWENKTFSAKNEWLWDYADNMGKAEN